MMGRMRDDFALFCSWLCCSNCDRECVSANTVRAVHCCHRYWILCICKRPTSTTRSLFDLMHSFALAWSILCVLLELGSCGVRSCIFCLRPTLISETG